MKIFAWTAAISPELANLIHPFTHNDEIIDNSILEDTDLISTDAEVTATRTRYVAEYSQQKPNDIQSHLWSAGSKDNTAVRPTTDDRLGREWCSTRLSQWQHAEQHEHAAKDLHVADGSSLDQQWYYVHMRKCFYELFPRTLRCVEGWFFALKVLGKSIQLVELSTCSM